MNDCVVNIKMEENIFSLRHPNSNLQGHNKLKLEEAGFWNSKDHLLKAFLSPNEIYIFNK